MRASDGPRIHGSRHPSSGWIIEPFYMEEMIARKVCLGRPIQANGFIPEASRLSQLVIWLFYLLSSGLVMTLFHLV